MRLIAVTFGLMLGCLCSVVCGEDWAQWRGPEQNGISREKNLIESWLLEGKAGENVLWTSDIGGRATPIVMNGRLYLDCRTPDDVNDPVQKIHARERVVCLDAETGELIWKDVFNVFQTDIPAPRVGWASMVGDPETGNVYVHSVSGIFRCYDRDGKLLWEHSLEEEYGKISGYGGRTHTPIIDEDRIIVSYLCANWGESKGPAPSHTYYAFDKATGVLQWTAPVGAKPEDTTYACPVVAVIAGQRMMVAPAADGSIHGLNARTGKILWSHGLSRRGMNVSPVVDGDLVYITHGEDNIDSTEFGRVECLKITSEGDAVKAESIWRVNGIKAGYSSPLVKDGILYVVADTGSLHAFDALKGDKLWEHSLGTVGKGSPAWADGKLYVMEVDGNVHILKPSREKCETLSHVSLDAGVGQGKDEIYASPAISNGLVYLVTRDRIICLGKKDRKVESDPIPPMAEEGKADEEVASLQLRPFEVAINAGGQVDYELHAFDKLGRFVKKMPASLALAAGLDGATVDGSTLKTDAVKASLAGHVSAKEGELTATARVRVFSELPWSWNFEEMTGVQVPPTWIRAHVKIKPTKMNGAKEDPAGTNTAMKMSPGPGKPSHTVFMGPPTMNGYTLQADVMLREQKRQLGSLGLTDQRYSLIIKGNNSKLSIQSWPAHLHMSKEIKFASKPDQWYTMKMRVDVADGIAHIKGKVWEQGKEEPAEWTIETEDPHANEHGSPGLYGYALADSYYDNVIISKDSE